MINDDSYKYPPDPMEPVGFELHNHLTGTIEFFLYEEEAIKERDEYIQEHSTPDYPIDEDEDFSIEPTWDEEWVNDPDAAYETRRDWNDDREGK